MIRDLDLVTWAPLGCYLGAASRRFAAAGFDGVSVSDAALVATLFSCARSDWAGFAVERRKTLAGAVAVSAGLLFDGRGAAEWLLRLAGAMAAGSLASCLATLFDGGLGRADVHVCMLMSLALGPKEAFWGLWLASCLALAFWRACPKRIDSRGRKVIPFVPWLYVACALIAALRLCQLTE